MAATVHVKRRLTDISNHYPQEQKLVADDFFPAHPTPFLTDQFAVWNKANLLQLEDAAPLGDDEEPPNIELKLDADRSFNCQVYGLQSPGKWITEHNADPSLDYDTERTIVLTNALRLRLEYLMYKMRLRATAYMTNNSSLAAANKFDNYTSGLSLPITTMRIIVNNIRYANGGRPPNRISATTLVWQAVANSEEFKDLVKFNIVQTVREAAERSSNGYIALIESLIGVEPGTIRLADAVYNAAASSQTAIYTTFAGPDIVFGFVEPLGIRSYSMAAKFQWSAYSNDPQAVIAVPRYQNTMVPTEDLRVFTVIDPYINQTDLGYLLQGAISTTQDIYGNSYGNIVAY